MEALIRRERVIAGAGIAGVTALAWAYVVHLGHGEAAMHAAMGMADDSPWDVPRLAVTFVMWAVMMVAMMLPSAAPMILMFVAVNRRRAADSRATVPTAVFVAGYIVVWSAFSAIATAVQWRLAEASLLTPMLEAENPVLGGTLLVAAGLFQWTPLKRACLVQCRSPLGFLMTQWREGARGAVVMGVRHGAYCLGCCWLLMALLFVAGVMNLAWVAFLAAFVLVEKVAPGGVWIGRAAGVALVVAGVAVALA